MRPDEMYYTRTKGNCTNGNDNDYEAMLRMLLKLNVPTVTFHKGNRKIIRSFGAHFTMEYVFEGNELIDIISRELSFLEWITSEFLLHKGDGAVITIYNN